MTDMSPVPADHPLMIAWTRYKAVPDFANTRRWALHEEHVEGSLWAAFMGGFTAASIMPHPTPEGGPVANPEGERLYQATIAQSRSELGAADEPVSLENAIRFIERWMPESLPANDHGQVPFGRALLEMALDAMKAAVAKEPAGAPEPCHDR